MQGYGELITLSKLRAVLSYQDRVAGCYGPAFRYADVVSSLLPDAVRACSCSMYGHAFH